MGSPTPAPSSATAPTCCARRTRTRRRSTTSCGSCATRASRRRAGRSASTPTAASGSSSSPATSPSRRTRRGPRSDMALATAAALLRRLHDVSARYVAAARRDVERRDGRSRRRRRVDPADLVVCHNDVCLENLVYRDRVAVGLLDFDFAAPGRRVHDLADVRPDERPDRHRRRRPPARPRRPVRPGPAAAHRRRRLRAAARSRRVPRRARRRASSAAASSCSAGSTRATRRSGRWSRPRAGWPSSTAAAPGSPPTATSSPPRSADGHPPFTSRGQTAPMSVRIVHVSDSHLGAGRAVRRRALGRRRRPRRDDAARPRRAHRRRQPRRRVGPRPTSPTAGSASGCSRCPWLALPGNHDIGDVDDADHPVDDARRGRWRDLFGDLWWATELGGWRLVGVDIQTLASTSPEAGEHWTWLQEQLAEPRPTVLFLHRPLRPVGRRVRRAPALRRRAAPRPRCSPSSPSAGVRVVASGHVHQHLVTSHDGVVHAWAPSTWAVLPDAVQPVIGAKQTGVLELDLHDDGTRRPPTCARPAWSTPSSASRSRPRTPTEPDSQLIQLRLRNWISCERDVSRRRRGPGVNVTGRGRGRARSCRGGAAARRRWPARGRAGGRAAPRTGRAARGGPAARRGSGGGRTRRRTTWSFGERVMSKRYGSSNTVSSRLADGYSSRIRSPSLHLLAVDLDVDGRRAVHVADRADPAQHLLDRARAAARARRAAGPAGRGGAAAPRRRRR